MDEAHEPRGDAAFVQETAQARSGDGAQTAAAAPALKARRREVAPRRRRTMPQKLRGADNQEIAHEVRELGDVECA